MVGNAAPGAASTDGADQPGGLIGRGRTAEVYRWGAGRVVKLFYPLRPAAAVEREARITAAVAAAALPAPRYDGPVQVGDRMGLLFERVAGRSMVAALVRRPWRTLQLADQLADLHLAIHRRPAPDDLQPLRPTVEAAIRTAPDLPTGAREQALRALAALPDGDRICHGDFHPDNVLLTPRGPVVIDWVTATRGCAAADVARTLLLLEHGGLPPGVGAATAVVATAVRRLFAWRYWRRYRLKSELRALDLAPWRLPLLAARLRESVPPAERRHLLRRLRAERDARP